MENRLQAPEAIVLPPSPIQRSPTFPPAISPLSPASPVSPSSPTSSKGSPSDQAGEALSASTFSPSFLAPPRTRSPYLRGHTRSRSLATPHPMIRAHSSPGLDGRGRYVSPHYSGGPTSPIELLSGRKHSPLRSGDDLRSLNLASLKISETISEHEELDTSSLNSSFMYSSLPSPTPSLPSSLHHTFPPRTSRKQQLSLPFSQSNPQYGLNQPVGSPVFSHSHPSPSTPSNRFNESYPGYSGSSIGASSMPSTPTSFRSRSPSISSLETIPDIPDAEAAALEAERIAQLKAAADQADAADANRLNSDPTNPSSGLVGSRSLGGYGIRGDKRKRWSVCGAERRQDLDLETIWED